jgi:signal transduction histidine kinase
MTIQSQSTQYAPAQRASKKRISRQAASIAGIPLLRPLFDAIPDVVLILNAQRQIVFANQALVNIARLDSPDLAISFRPGEILDCIHASESEGGCGTTEFCQTCGAVKAILASLRGDQAVQESRIRLKNGDALDLQVFASPLVLDGQTYSFFVLKDISHAKRRRILERVFFHDILNSAGALHGLAEVLRRAPAEEKDAVAEDIELVSDRLIDEIKSQKELAAAENNELNVEQRLINTGLFLEELVHFYQNYGPANGLQLCLSDPSCDIVLFSDPTLLRRVLGNMLKNAIEACHANETVTLGCRAEKGRVEFWVHNPGFISPDVRMQIFQRSFSTKGAGRGLGTYSIKLLGERYLRGKVSFTSSLARGTTFKISLPVE